MARFLVFTVFFGVAFWLSGFAIWTTFRRPQDDRVYRPQPRWMRWPGGSEQTSRPGTMHLVTRAELDGLRDAYSSAPIDPAKPLLRCGTCLATYHAESIAELDRSNHGRCVVCDGTDLAAVYVADEA